MLILVLFEDMDTSSVTERKTEGSPVFKGGDRVDWKEAKSGDETEQREDRDGKDRN